MSASQLWLQNHNRRLTQDAIDEALMEYISLVESQRDALMKQRDELVAALEEALPMVPCGSFSNKKLTELEEGGHLTAAMILRHRSTIAIVKGKS